MDYRHLAPPWITPARGAPNRTMQPIHRRRVSSYTPTDADAITYLAAVATADGAALNSARQKAVDEYFLALKSNSIWALINQLFLFCGPATLAGALRAAKGANPTSNGFGAANHDPKLGLAGNGTSLYLNTNTLANSISATNHHFSVTCSSGLETTGDRIACGSFNGSTGVSLLSLDISISGLRAFRSGTFTGYPSLATGLGSSGYFCGSKAASNNTFVDYNGTTAVNTTSVTPSFVSQNIYLYALNQNNTPAGFTSMVCQIYTRGASLTTAQSATLRSLNNAYISAIAAS